MDLNELSLNNLQLFSFMYASIYVCMFYFIGEKTHLNYLLFILLILLKLFLLYFINFNYVFIFILFNYLVILTLIRIRIIYMHHMHLFYMKLNLSGTISVLKYLMFNKTLQW